MSHAATAANDRQLTAEHIGQLENAQQVVAFFAALGYDADRAIPLDHASLGLDSADLRQQIKHIRRVAEDPMEGNIVVYLFEARSVTVSLTQAIARRFRERTEDALLVLTRDYETLDFVLLERELAAGRSRLGGGLRPIIRPRSLTVQRRNPGPVALRVLKRFTVTEEDADYQWDKLRSAFTLAEWSEQYFNNRALFSDYYLLERLADPQLSPAWAEDVRPIGREVLRHLSRARAAFSKQPEQVVRQQLYEPLFQSLGFEFQVHKPGNSDLAEPDYRLYAPGDRSQPIALAMTYVWNRNLDDADPVRDGETPQEIPGALVVNVLAAAEAPWVIVTNGKLWRLYAAAADNKASNYYEVDLEEAAQAQDQQTTALRYWWLFFRRQAFQGFLDQLRQQSADYARSLGERLKERTFTTIFPHFARGFVQTPRVSETLGVSLDAAFQATLTFLYRLMFVLYAESLSLLPVAEERGYGELSLQRLKRELAEAGGPIEDEAPRRLAAHYRADSTALYGRLQRLFQAIDAGDAALNLPMYNGGLFSSSTPEGRFLREHAIPDRFLALGLDRLCRDVDEKTQALATIDYKSLGVRQLGSIYEGLLEFKLRVAAEPLAVVKEKGKEVYLPAKEAGGKRVVATLAAGDVYLENDKRERKATGSYYTPDYIVKYIVEHTVGPVLEARFAALEPRLRAAQKLYRQRREHALAKGEDPEKFWNNADMQRLADDCLDVRVLDPAMGSGHFLVEAVDFVGDRLIQFLNAWSENPVWALLARTRQDILLDMERQGVSIDAERLTRVSLLKRSVLKRCIYGVDLNPMAVELAKVSLWLDAFTLGAPLSFLDHHLKCGNSLIGALDLSGSIVPGTERWNSVARAAANIVLVSKLVDATPGEVVASAQNYKNARKDLEPTIQRLNVSIAAHFADLGDIGQAQQYAYLDDDARKAQRPVTVQKFEASQEIAANKRFFHWKLEFPEVFIDERFSDWRQDGGFDAVVGNPPYVATSEEQSDKDWRASLMRLGSNLMARPTKRQFQTLHLKWDTYIPFVEQFFNLTSNSGLFGSIIPSSFCVAPYAQLSRKLLTSDTTLLHLVHFPDVFLFENVGVLNIVFVAQCSLASFEHTPLRIVSKDKIMRNISRLPRLKQARTAPDELFNPMLPATQWDQVDCVSLGGICYINKGGTLQAHDILYRGAFVKDDLISETQESTHPKPYIEGKDIGRGEVLRQRYLEYGAGTRNPAMVMEARFPEMFENPKLVFGKTSGIYLDINDKFWCDQSARVAVPFQYLTGKEASSVNSQRNLADSSHNLYALGYLYAVSASSLILYHLKRTSTDVRDITPETIKSIPVKRIQFTTYPDRRAQLATKGRALYQRCLAEGHACVLDFVAHHLDLGESDVVHDLLAFLAGQMIDLNQQKQAETKRFLGWLEGTLRIKVPGTADSARHLAGIDSLTGKTILQGYLGDYQKGERETPWADFYYRLHQNRNRFAGSLEAVKGEIEAEYERSLAVLLPIKRQLATTDALIDQIVYQLYGLSDEEIAIVEGPAYQQALGDAKAEVLKDKTLAADPEAAVEAMAEKVLPAAQRLQSQVTLAAERARLEADLPGWQLFPDEVRTFLLTGEYNIASQPDFLDFSTSVVSYAKAVEAMLYHRLFVRFRAESGAGEADCKNKFLQQFMAGQRELTLGSMPIILASSKEAALRAFVQQLYPRAAQTFYGPAGVVERLADEAALALRNAAAHDQALTRADAQSARAWALGILQYL